MGGGMARPQPWQNRASAPFGRPHSGQYRLPGGALCAADAADIAAMFCWAYWRWAARTSGGTPPPVDELPPDWYREEPRKPFPINPSPKMHTMAPGAMKPHPNDAEVVFPLPEELGHEGRPISPGRFTPKRTPFVETRMIPNTRMTMPRMSDSSRTLPA